MNKTFLAMLLAGWALITAMFVSGAIVIEWSLGAGWPGGWTNVGRAFWFACLAGWLIFGNIVESQEA